MGMKSIFCLLAIVTATRSASDTAGRNFFHVDVIDGAFKDTGDRIIEHIETHYGKHVYINNMALSHACDDHAPGLIKVLEHFDAQSCGLTARGSTPAILSPAFTAATRCKA